VTTDSLATMEHFSPVPLSGSGRPILLTNEVEIKSESRVSVVTQEKKKVTGELFMAGFLVLTNFRMVVILTEVVSSKSTSIGWGFELRKVVSVEDCSRLFRTSTRIRMCFEAELEIGLRFEKDGKEEFRSAVQKALDKKSWETNMVSPKQIEAAREKNAFSSSNAGVAGIIRRQERSQQNVDSIAKDALSDLDTLMRRAREAIAVVERYASYTAGEKTATAEEDELSETTSQAVEKNEMETIMQNIGIISPVTKFSAGRQYHQQLARQVADILLAQGRLDRLGGMITLTDLYCIFNRARGTELVSPDDLLKAATITKHLGLGMHLRVFPSGVKVLQADSYSEEHMGARILGVVDGDAEYRQFGIQAQDLAMRLNISLLVAKEQLLIAERMEHLCRDESPQGLFFYPNSFNTYACS